MSTKTSGESRHEIDIEETADRINVAPDAIAGVLDQMPEEHVVTAFHTYGSAIGIVELKDRLTMANVEGTPYALVSFSGHVFPFHPGDVESIAENMESVDYDFNKEEE